MLRFSKKKKNLFDWFDQHYLVLIFFSSTFQHQGPFKFSLNQSSCHIPACVSKVENQACSMQQGRKLSNTYSVTCIEVPVDDSDSPEVVIRDTIDVINLCEKMARSLIQHH